MSHIVPLLLMGLKPHVSVTSTISHLCFFVHDRMVWHWEHFYIQHFTSLCPWIIPAQEFKPVWMNFMNEKQRWHPHLACEWVWELAPLVTCTRSISLSLSPVALFRGWAEQTATHSSSSSGRFFISAGLPRLCLLLMPCSLPGFFWVHSPEPSFYRLTLFRLLADWLMMAVIQIAAGPPPKTPNLKWDDTYSFTNFSHRSQICKSK